MNCRKIKRYFEEYIDESLSENKRLEFDNHLRNCPDCKKNLLQRQQLGGMLSTSLKKMALNQELSSKTVKSILSNAGKNREKPVQSLILRPRLAVYTILPLLVLGLVLIFMQTRSGNNQVINAIDQEPVSYLKLTTTHYLDTPSGKRIIKRTHIKRSNGEEGFLTLELIRDLKK